MVRPTLLVGALASLALSLFTRATLAAHHPASEPISPKVMIITGFTPEREIWYPYNLTNDYPMPGFIPTYQNVSCTASDEICVMTMGQAEIGNGIAMTLLWSSPMFNLTETYFLIAGIGGVNPRYSTIGGVALARYVVQVEMGMAFAGSDLPANFSDLYFFPSFVTSPNQYPSLAGTEVYGLNGALRDKVASLVAEKNISFADNPTAQAYRSKYTYAPARAAPTVDKCDVASAEVYWSGEVYARNVEYYVDLISNGTAKYCNTNEDDTGTMAGLLRGAMLGKLDFSRIVIAKGNSDFDRPPPGLSAYQNLMEVAQNGFEICLQNLFAVGSTFINDLVANWHSTYKHGVKTQNYVGDVCGYLGGTPDFGPGHC
ncbi:purine nucleoside permease [Xylona heveae TC161]|uniref:Purine nucleoside permease n=1 Tax=Xylona heveae (strain CBS 132557 / TC161) TaxID=1328760 RepID=A0A165H0H2_XYLHT|nr:purine nucleoside permease [Xylona heveae TC161]KZF22833.1 purine nucleoside permease [Xylona heveae TC161]